MSSKYFAGFPCVSTPSPVRLVPRFSAFEAAGLSGSNSVIRSAAVELHPLVAPGYYSIYPCLINARHAKSDAILSTPRRPVSRRLRHSTQKPHLKSLSFDPLPFSRASPSWPSFHADFFRAPLTATNAHDAHNRQIAPFLPAAFSTGVRLPLGWEVLALPTARQLTNTSLTFSAYLAR